MTERQTLLDLAGRCEARALAEIPAGLTAHFTSPAHVEYAKNLLAVAALLRARAEQIQ